MPSVTSFFARPGRGEPSSFLPVWQAAAARPLAEILPATPGDAAGALGFALAWTAAAADGTAPLLWIAPEACLVEDGAPYAPGLAQFGFSLPRLLLVRTRAQQDAYWAAEQALAVPKARVLCAVAQRSALSLVASRRLLLAAEKSGARCLLLRFDALAASASWSRWRVAAAPSEGPARELGRPRFLATIERDRGGRAGRRWLVEWSADDHGFKECALDGDLAERSVDGSFAPRRRRAG